MYMRERYESPKMATVVQVCGHRHPIFVYLLANSTTDGLRWSTPRHVCRLGGQFLLIIVVASVSAGNLSGPSLNSRQWWPQSAQTGERITPLGCPDCLYVRLWNSLILEKARMVGGRSWNGVLWLYDNHPHYITQQFYYSSRSGLRGITFSFPIECV